MAAAVLLLLMLLAGLNYNNSLALLLCFLLAGSRWSACTNATACWPASPSRPAMSSRPLPRASGELTLQFDNPRQPCAPAAHDPLCAVRRNALRAAAGRRTGGAAAVSRAGERGRQRIERLELSSDAPLGLFRAWTLAASAARGADLSGARRRCGRRRRRATAPTAARQPAPQSGEEDWAWLRPFREGDSPRRVAWKAYARGGPLWWRTTMRRPGCTALLDCGRCGTCRWSWRLSQLAQWVLDCERQGESYALELPGA